MKYCWAYECYKGNKKNSRTQQYYVDHFFFPQNLLRSVPLKKSFGNDFFPLGKGGHPLEFCHPEGPNRLRR
jgi:hypothetical protein